MDSKIEDKVINILKKLTLEEKVSMCHGCGLFRNGGVKRLSIPPIIMSDGPCGVRRDFHDDSWNVVDLSYNNVSYLPANTALAATWNIKRARAGGRVLGRETRGRGKDMILAPGINIMRSPLCGRNYEYMGEDPFLTSQLAVQFIKGVQGEGVAACVKHFALNNQETNRLKINVEVGERALREIYLPGFESAVKEGGVYAVMSAYNKFRGMFCSHNRYLLKNILKEEWAFDGVVVSDWGAVHDTVEPANNGLDIEMNVTTDFDNYNFAEKLVQSVRSGKVPESEIDDKVKRMLRLIFKLGMTDPERKSGGFNLPECRRECLKTALESVTLLKNDRGILPFNDKKIKRLLVVGPAADTKNAPAAVEGDSGDMCALYEITPLTGIMMRLGGNINVEYEKGCGENHNENDELMRRAVEKASSADAVIFVGGLNRGFDCEGKDRNSIELPYEQEKLINKLLSANDKTVVVLISGSPVGMSGFADNAHTIVQGFYAGMESGYALAKVLFGDFSPCGKLPFTIPRSDCDVKAEISDGENVIYSEGLYVGYRYYDKFKVEPQFCFGHGLSYTSFDYSALVCTKKEKKKDVSVNVEVTIENTGKIAGAEIIQLYVSPKSRSVDSPKQELKGFKKIFLKPSEKRRIAIRLNRRSFSFYDENEKKWICEKGTYEIRICSSSRDIRQKAEINIDKTLKY